MLETRRFGDSQSDPKKQFEREQQFLVNSRRVMVMSEGTTALTVIRSITVGLLLKSKIRFPLTALIIMKLFIQSQ